MKRILTAFLILLAALSTAFAAGQKPGDEITIAAVGDIMLGGRAEPFLREFGPGYPFTEVMPVLGRADIAAGNL